MSENPGDSSHSGGHAPGTDEAKKKFDAFMSLNVDPFEDWQAGEEGGLSSEDEEWNPPSQDSPSSHSDSDSDGSQIQEGLLQSDEEGDDPNPLDSTAIIATRTRARVPLTNVLLSDLEGKLPEGEFELNGELDSSMVREPFEGIEGDNTLQWDDEEYSQSMSPGMSPSGQQTYEATAVGGFTAQETQYMNYIEAEQREKGYEQFLQVLQQGSADLPPELAEDDPEYYVDPESYTSMPDEWQNLVGKISRSEVEALLRDGAPIGIDGRYLTPTEGDGPHRAADALRSSTGSHGSYDSSGGSEPEDEASLEMTSAQRLMLHQQMLQMLQLQLQVYLLSRHIDGNAAVSEAVWELHNRFVAYSTSASTSYKPPPHHLIGYQTMSQALGPASSAPLHANSASSSRNNVSQYPPSSPPLQINPHILTVETPGGLNTSRSPVSTPHPALMADITSGLNSPEMARTAVGRGMTTGFSSSQLNDSSMRADRASTASMGRGTVPAAANGSTTNGQASNGGGSERAKAGVQVKPFLASALALPTVVLVNQEVLAKLHGSRGLLSKVELNRYLGLYQTIFRQNMLPNVDTRATMSAMTSTVNAKEGMISTGGSTARYRWSPVEDDLLAIGFSLFHKNWNLIRLRLLPSKDPLAISTRFKNKTSKKSKDNPIKTALAYNTRPLTNDERDLLTLGVSELGQNFELISSRYLPSRKPQFLAKSWRQMTAASKTKKGLKSSKAVSVQSEGPASTEDPQMAFILEHEAQEDLNNATQAFQFTEPDISVPMDETFLTPATGHATDDIDNRDRNRALRHFDIATSLADPPQVVLPSAVDNDIDHRDRNRTLRHLDVVSTHSRASSSSSAHDDSSHQPQNLSGAHFLQVPHGDREEDERSFSARSWDSEDSDGNIIESTHNSSEVGSGSDSDGTDNPSAAKRSKYSELSDNTMHSYVPGASSTVISQHYYQAGAGSHPGSYHGHHAQQPDSGIPHRNDPTHMSVMMDTEAAEFEEDLAAIQAARERDERYPEDYHTRPFHASSYLGMLLDWEVIWQEEAVQAAIAAAETIRLERMSGKAKPVAAVTSKSKSRAKNSKGSKAKKDKLAKELLNSAATVISATSADWDHELWLSPPSSPEPSSAPSSASEHQYLPQHTIPPYDAAILAQIDPIDLTAPSASIFEGSDSPPTTASSSSSSMTAVSSSNRGITEGVNGSGFSIRLAERPSSTPTASAPSNSSALPGAPRTEQHNASKTLRVQGPSSGSPPIPNSTHKTTETSEQEQILMQRRLEKEVRQTTAYVPKHTTKSHGNASAAHPQHNSQQSTHSLPVGMFSVMMPSGRVISSNDFISDSSASTSRKSQPSSKH
jgi:hypothetical protein